MLLRLSERLIQLITLIVLLTFSGVAFSETSSVAKRIVALSPHSVELLFALGAGDRIVATTAFADFPEEAKKIPQVGGYNGIQIEKVLGLKPDLVVAWEGGNPSSDLDQLERLGLNVYRSETNRLSDIQRELTELGERTGLSEKANELNAKFRADWSALKQEYADRKPVSFFYQLWHEPMRTMAAGSWINEIMEACGGENIFSNPELDYPQVSLEAILQAKPQAIIVPTHHGAVEGSATHWASWKEIPAVKNQHIFKVDGDVLHRFSLRVIEGMKSVCQAFEKVRADH